MRIAFLLVLSCFVLSCTHTQKQPIPVSFGDRDALFFTGKGAAAGIMMDAFLNGAGVAIGIAIDEGIAKDISAAIQKANPQFDIRNLVREQLVTVSKELVTENWQGLVIEKYGFQVGDGDFVSPVLELRVNCTDGARPIRFEKDSTVSNEAELGLIKTDGKVAEGLLQRAVVETIDSGRLSSMCKK